MLMKPDQFAPYGSSFRAPEPSVKAGFLTRLVMKLEAYAEQRRQRLLLLSLSDRLLKDIGLGRSEAESIAHEPFRWSENRTEKRP